MPSEHSERYDFFLSRRGSVAPIAQEVADVLTEKGYKVLVQDYDIPLGTSFIEAMHRAVMNSRDLIILFTQDYERSPYTRKEFTSFEAERAQSAEERHIIVLRCEDVPLRGLLADNVYQDLVGIEDPEERKRRIIAAAERQSQAAPPPPRPFIGVPPGSESFGDSYARTIREWQRRFQNAWPSIQPLGFDDRFKRAWEYYLAYCRAGFEAATLSVGLYQIGRSANSC